MRRTYVNVWKDRRDRQDEIIEMAEGMISRDLTAGERRVMLSHLGDLSPMLDMISVLDVIEAINLLLDDYI